MNSGIWAVVFVLNFLWVRVDVAGDFALGRKIGQTIAEKTPQSFFLNLKKILSESDFSFCNLEGCLKVPAENQPENVIETRPKARFDLSFSDEHSLFLKETGFHAFGAANNHQFDSGTDNLEKLRAITGTNIIRGVQLQKVRSLSFAIIAFDYSSPGRESWKIDLDKHSDRVSFLKTVRDLSQTNCTIVFLHGGKEDSDYVSLQEREFFKKLIDAGAIGVFCCHAHRKKRIEWYKGKPIYYSLGSVLFDRVRFPDKLGLMVRIHFWANCPVYFEPHFIEIRPDLTPVCLKPDM
ncbi:MAG: CapA family protein [Candidatus Riflebacteria bacterium]|nr:CapA family protein [Candidatus Riflebacteria bacterium]